MDYTFDLVEGDILQVTTVGNYSLDDNTDFLTAIRDKLDASGATNLLIDYRNSSISFDFLTTFDRPALYESIVGKIRPSKIALIFTSLNDKHSFFEDVCNNRGWNILAFDTFEKGVEWLQGSRGE